MDVYGSKDMDLNFLNVSYSSFYSLFALDADEMHFFEILLNLSK